MSPPTSGKTLTLRVKHSSGEVARPLEVARLLEVARPLEVTLGSTKIQLKPSSKSSFTIDDITLYPIEVSGSSESDHLSFEPEVRNDIFIRFIGSTRWHGHFIDDIELLDENGLEYMPHSAYLSNPNGLWELKDVFKDDGVCFFFFFIQPLEFFC